MPPRQLAPGGSLKDSPYNVPLCPTGAPSFSNCERVDKNGCAWGTWTCLKPAYAFTTINGQKIPLDLREIECLKAQNRIREQAIQQGLNYERIGTNVCTPPRVWKPKKSGIGGLFDSIVEGLTSGNLLRTFSTLGGLLFPTLSLAVLQPKSFTEQLVLAAGESIGVKRQFTELAIAAGEVVLTGSSKSWVDDFLRGVAPKGVTMGFWDDITSGIGSFFSGLKATDVLSVAAPVVQSLTARPMMVAQAPMMRPAQAFVPQFSSLQYGVPNLNVGSYGVNGGVMNGMARPMNVSLISGAMTIIGPILAKIAETVGRNMTLQRALSLARTLGRQLNSPALAATAMGITLAELAMLITAGTQRKRRRMNPANSKALRRAARRIESFHKLCARTDMLRSRGRRRSSATCGTCRKRPCRC